MPSANTVAQNPAGNVKPDSGAHAEAAFFLGAFGLVWFGLRGKGRTHKAQYADRGTAKQNWAQR
jgi:hypothetical protein